MDEESSFGSCNRQELPDLDKRTIAMEKPLLVRSTEAIAAESHAIGDRDRVSIAAFEVESEWNIAVCDRGM